MWSVGGKGAWRRVQGLAGRGGGECVSGWVGGGMGGYSGRLYGKGYQSEEFEEFLLSMFI